MVRRGIAIATLFVCYGTIRAQTGVITGVIDQPNAVSAITAIDRTDEKEFPGPKKFSGRIDANTGRFTIQGLPVQQVPVRESEDDTDAKKPVAKAYDVIIDVGSVRLEGVNLTVPRSDYEEEQPLTEGEKKKLDKEARRLDKFMNEIDVLAITGNIQNAAVLMNKRRTTAFYESKPGEIVWRLELWRFHKPDETWIKSTDELWLTMYRQRLQKSEYEKKILTLDPALGGLRFSGKEAKIDLGKVVLPGKEPGIKLRKENIKEVAKTETEKDS